MSPPTKGICSALHNQQFLSKNNFMNYNEFLSPLIVRLRTLQKDDNAAPFFDCMSRAFIWSDEKLHGLSVDEMGCLRSLFRYRTNLIVQGDHRRFESLWADLKETYPDWIDLALSVVLQMMFC
jgi:hypothetical protein